MSVAGEFVVWQPPGCQFRHRRLTVDHGERHAEVDEFRCDSPTRQVEVQCAGGLVSENEWKTALNGLFAGGGPTDELSLERISKFWPEPAVHVHNDVNEATRRVGVSHYRGDRSCRLLVSFAVGGDGLQPDDVARIKASFLSTEAARTAIAELPLVSANVADLDALTAKIASRRFADSLQAERVLDDVSLEGHRARYGVTPLVFNFRDPRETARFGRTLVLYAPKSQHALLDAFQLERVVPEYDNLTEQGYSFRAERAPDIGEYSELHVTLSPFPPPELSAAVSFVRCGVFADVTIWAGSRGDALKQARAVARDVDAEIRATVCRASKKKQ